MFSKSLLLLAVAAAAASAQTVNFIYTTSSFVGIQNSGSGYSTGFYLVDTSGNQIYSNSDPYGYAPCQSSSEKFTMTADCFSGTWTFGCESNFGGEPQSCTAYNPSGDTTDGEVNNSNSFTGISAGSDGYCGASVDLGGSCTADSSFTITGHYTGDYKSTS